MAAADTIHRACTGYVHPQHGRVVVALCTKQPWKFMQAGESVSVTGKVNCPDCISQLAWIDRDYATGELVLHWPAAVEDAAPLEVEAAA
jgi:hypothetical protein